MMGDGNFEFPQSSEVQVWNNAAFDNGESEDSLGLMKTSSSSSRWNQSLESSTLSSKENMSPLLEKSSSVVSFKNSSASSLPIKPLNSNSTIANTLENVDIKKGPLKIVLRKGGGGGLVSKNVNQEEERLIDKEIEDIEKKIKRLSSRLEALRLEKAEKSLRISTETRGRIVPAKFKEPPKQNSVKLEEAVPPPKSVNRRGMSLGPSEIYSATNKAKMMMTPASAKSNSRRKSCFWKLEEIDELKATKERGKSLSASPRSRKNASKIQAPKMAATTIGGASRKFGKKDEGVLASIHPKTLFKDGEKSVPNSKKSVKPGRVVASRYNQISSTSEARKRSLPDSDKEDGYKRRASRENGVGNQRRESGVGSTKAKKKWEIPSELVVFKSEDCGGDAVMVEESFMVCNPLKSGGDVLPKIKTFRCVNETPRDSGAAKRVADLVGKKSFFAIDEGDENAGAGDSVCQALKFDFEEDDD